MDMPFMIDAEYVDGQFRPLSEVKLPENARVRLTVQPLPTWEEWLARVAKHRAEMFAENGYCFDSTEIVAADRRRDG
jgi:predicted DNA-binding antitoxin AbrB/MazE fold protein